MNLLTLNGTVENSSILPKFEDIYPGLIDPDNIVLHDSFLSNFGLLDSHPIEKSPTTQNWQNIGGAAWTVFAEGYASANSAGNNLRVVNHATSGKVYIAAEAGVASGYIGIVIRANDNANYLRIGYSTTNGNIYLRKRIAGVNTDTVIGSNPIVFGRVYHIGVTYDESGFDVYIDDKKVVSVEDTTLSTNTKVGMESGSPLQKIWEFAAS